MWIICDIYGHILIALIGSESEKESASWSSSQSATDNSRKYRCSL